MNMEYIIIGAGITSATFANLAARQGHKVTVIEKNSFIGGNCYDLVDDKTNVLYHQFGPHIMHFDSEEVYSFISQFTKLNSFRNKVLASVQEKLSPVPFNWTSIETYFPLEAKDIIDELNKDYKENQRIPIMELMENKNPLIKKMAQFAFDNIFVNYTTKMWGLRPDQLDKSVMARVPFINGRQDTYFSNKYEGLPIDGYTKMIERMFDHQNITIKLNTNGLEKLSFVDNKVVYGGNANATVIYCGELDELFNYKHGKLPYRSLHIEFETGKQKWEGEPAVVNYPAHPTMTRICDYNKMTNMDVNCKETIFSKEFPGQYDRKDSKWNKPYYPILNEENSNKYNVYKQEAGKFTNLLLLGRLAEYKYYDMDKAIERAMNLFKEQK